ncbi:FkbM family methyltransferase [Tolypothrix sp. PCC 7910]|uniref:FkbM family methyltransferase n=1 Tax=Tolypothrix sp. PCC 7910 TaxID=2099387 RepID=UPI0014277BBB|nr:FkbM family methyltransferase [Tolypothrix sp. PCC 7910]QIR39573.1 FkbM family methyltransferase [Tolypothrix sp. PCC 7910]
MKLYESKLNYIGKSFAVPLSKVLTSKLFYKPSRYIEAYLAFLLGKGAGSDSIEEEVKAALSNIYRQYPVVFDVGANVGLWSSQILKYQPHAQLFQFEPSETCILEIQKLNLPNSTLIPCAIGKMEGITYLYSSSQTDGSASLYQRKDGRFKDYKYQKYSVSITTIDKVIADYSIEFVDFMKMDIEGHEMEALLGASQSLNENKIGAISFEFGSGNINSRTFFRDFWHLLQEKGFEIYRITPGGKLLEIQDYYEDLEYFRGVSNYIARLTDHPYASSK